MQIIRSTMAAAVSPYLNLLLSTWSSSSHRGYGMENSPTKIAIIFVPATYPHGDWLRSLRGLVRRRRRRRRCWLMCTNNNNEQWASKICCWVLMMAVLRKFYSMMRWLIGGWACILHLLISVHSPLSCLRCRRTDWSNIRLRLDRRVDVGFHRSAYKSALPTLIHSLNQLAYLPRFMSSCGGSGGSGSGGGGINGISDEVAVEEIVIAGANDDINWTTIISRQRQNSKRCQSSSVHSTCGRFYCSTVGYIIGDDGTIGTHPYPTN